MSEPKKNKFSVAGNTKLKGMMESQERAEKTSKSSSVQSTNAPVETNKKTGYTHVRITKDTKVLLEDVRHAMRKEKDTIASANDLVSEGLRLYCEKYGIDLSKY